MTLTDVQVRRAAAEDGGAPVVAVVRDSAVTCGAARDADALGRAVLAAGAAPAAAADVPVADFDPVAELGRKGIRTLDRSTLLAAATVGRLIAGCPVDGTTTGLVMGTAAGSLASTMGFTRDALEGDRPYLVDPARFPNTVMNFAAGQCAIRYGLRGPNATVTAGRSTAAAAVRYAARWLALGHADRVIVAATEELTAQRAQIERVGGRLPAGQGLGEGAVALLLEPPGATTGPALAEVLAVSTAMSLSADADRVSAAVRGCVETVLRAAGGAPVAVHAPFDAADGSAERTAVRAVLGDVPTLATAAVVGEVSSVSGFLQLLAAVTVLRQGAAPTPAAAAATGLALVTGVDPEGVVSALLVRPVTTA
ncbi:beta-ketoacyl synthase N-terminal-like domain-containing protein [Cellulomonas shaoxiangyii]|uniref:3-oxoacyl-ACP synthase n=1 Tax=Cellulomonas shaoxiangyii TaxID=2566013 RepID=A0A4P7SIL1_9CELL|nr:beta-ketoacyl synthase N-terminal-like domain-containing protein [Cellulomonas shaoxiangyii]QCB92293.1 3-oxoacyl-ACP synthase [Cellulomonas shaoxiangyii]TGY85895.1 3-oxoacyl-ACP synthase [Cellulomonas shaoxiangyii]